MVLKSLYSVILTLLVAAFILALEVDMASASSAVVVGYTGESGKALVRELVDRQAFKRLVLYGRRKPAWTEKLPSWVEVKVLDFDNMKAEDFAGFHQCFNALGSTITHQGREMFLKVDRDYTLKVIDFAKQGGCKHFHHVSSMGARESWFSLYMTTKFQTEEAAIAAGFPILSIYQPGVLMCDREESRPLEKLFRNYIMAPISWLVPTWWSTPTEILAKAMTNRALKIADQNQAGNVRVDNAEIFRWANDDAETAAVGGKNEL